MIILTDRGPPPAVLLTVSNNPPNSNLRPLGIIKNHPFLDGNKRTGYVVMETFLERMGSSSGWGQPQADGVSPAILRFSPDSRVKDQNQVKPEPQIIQV